MGNPVAVQTEITITTFCPGGNLLAHRLSSIWSIARSPERWGTWKLLRPEALFTRTLALNGVFPLKVIVILQLICLPVPSVQRCRIAYSARSLIMQSFMAILNRA